MHTINNVPQYIYAHQKKQQENIIKKDNQHLCKIMLLK